MEGLRQDMGYPMGRRVLVAMTVLAVSFFSVYVALVACSHVHPDGGVSDAFHPAYDETAEWEESISYVQAVLDCDRSLAEDVMYRIYGAYREYFGYPCYALGGFRRDGSRGNVYHTVSSEGVRAMVMFDEGYHIETIEEE